MYLSNTHSKRSVNMIFYTGLCCIRRDVFLAHREFFKMKPPPALLLLIRLEIEAIKWKEFHQNGELSRSQQWAAGWVGFALPVPPGSCHARHWLVRCTQPYGHLLQVRSRQETKPKTDQMLQHRGASSLPCLPLVEAHPHFHRCFGTFWCSSRAVSKAAFFWVASRRSNTG